jgi:hypothetical protein
MYGVRPSSTYSSPDMSSGMFGACGTYATSSARRRALRSPIGAPSTAIVPVCGTSPAVARRIDDLPAPLGPMRQSHSPGRTVSVKPWIASRRP